MKFINIDDYQVAEHFLCMAINGDFSGLSDREIEQWEYFEKRELECVARRYPNSHSHWDCGPMDEDVEYDEGGFGECDVCGDYARVYTLRLVTLGERDET